MYSTVQNAVYNVDYGHLKFLDLSPGSLKLFRLMSGPWNSSFWPCYWQL